MNISIFGETGYDFSKLIPHLQEVRKGLNSIIWVKATTYGKYDPTVGPAPYVVFLSSDDDFKSTVSPAEERMKLEKVIREFLQDLSTPHNRKCEVHIHWT